MEYITAIVEAGARSEIHRYKNMETVEDLGAMIIDEDFTPKQS